MFPFGQPSWPNFLPLQASSMVWLTPRLQMCTLQTLKFLKESKCCYMLLIHWLTYREFKLQVTQTYSLANVYLEYALGHLTFSHSCSGIFQWHLLQVFPLILLHILALRLTPESQTTVRKMTLILTAFWFSLMTNDHLTLCSFLWENIRIRVRLRISLLHALFWVGNHTICL